MMIPRLDDDTMNLGRPEGLLREYLLEYPHSFLSPRSMVDLIFDFIFCSQLRAINLFLQIENAD